MTTYDSPPKSDTPRKAGGLLSWAASKAVGAWVKTSPKATPALETVGSYFPTLVRRPRRR